MRFNDKKSDCNRVRHFRKPKNLHRNRGYALGETENLTDSSFKRMFRIDRDSFNELLENIDPYITFDSEHAINSSGSSIAKSTRLAITLRWLAGASYIDYVLRGE